ncbi:hypothetical protein EJ08DRAFT_234133 [Tothia fuscella]|uniref:C2H2-type domain-containing protein n=1 Tax=Tothia fuscella TaxID=1048955 RepID=A0A9P4P2Z2_9PEZI|nr:hypothetical protein EJ08DRAFT_234133 [Tothia fuscella]
MPDFWDMGSSVWDDTPYSFSFELETANSDAVNMPAIGASGPCAGFELLGNGEHAYPNLDPAQDQQIAKSIDPIAQVTQADKSSPPSTNSKPPTLNTDQNSAYTCSHPTCSKLHFSRQCDLNQHDHRKHNRPHKCTVQQCKSTGLSSKLELQRHPDAVHGKHQRFCLENGCSRAETATVKRPFHRQDHLEEHMRRKHQSALSNDYQMSMAASTPTLKRSREADVNANHDVRKQLKQSALCDDENQLELESLKEELAKYKEMEKELRAEFKTLRDINERQTRIIDGLTQ